MSEERKLVGALPAGSLQEPCLDLWRKAGYQLTLGERSYFPSVDDPDLDLILLRPQEIPQFVAEGMLDFGICGYDCILEARCEDRIFKLTELMFSKVSRQPTTWVLAVPEDSSIREIGDLEKGSIIYTEFVSMTLDWLKKKGTEADVRFSWGATEVKPGRFCDAIVEATETGRSLRKNGLRIVAEVEKSTARFITSRGARDCSWKSDKMDDIVLMLRGTLDAEGKVGLMLNVRRENLPAVTEVLPSLHSPTISSLTDPEWCAVNTIIEETIVRAMIPRLKRAGAMGIVEYPLNKIIL